MPANQNGKNYAIGKGRLYFDLFAPGSMRGIGELYFGNTPEFTLSQSQDTLDHIDADQGMNIKDDSVVTSSDLTGTLATDNMTMDNWALWLGGSREKQTVASGTAIVDTDFTVTRGRRFQIGVTDDRPQGARKIDNVVVKKVVPPVAPATDPTLVDVPIADNFDVDLVRGGLYVELDAPDVAEGDVLRVTYDQTAYTNDVVIAKGTEIRGALRYEADNPKGPNQDAFMPYVKLTANGDFAFKSDSWQQMSFNVEVLKKDGSTERLYLDGTPAA